MGGQELYDAMGDDYETMVSWDSRIANETPFFREVFEERSVRSVADVACGVGRHAVAFASWGLAVTGADPSSELLARARSRADESGPRVTFVNTDFLHLADALDGTFDAVVCIGNSLPHLLVEDDVLEALKQMNRVLAPGGLLVVQTRGAERIWARGSHLLAPVLRRAGENDLIFLRMVDVHPPTTTLNVIRLSRRHDTRTTRTAGDPRQAAAGKIVGWDVDTKTTELRPIARAEMERLLGLAGFGSADYYGDYRRTPFAGDDSEDLLVVATKTEGT